MSATGKRYHWTSEQKAEMVRLYVEDEFSLEDIAKTLGTKRETIRYHLRRSGTTLRPRGMQTSRARAKYSGPRHHGWNGGRCMDHGYWRVLVRDHPRADKDGYVLEHRLVVELHLRSHDPHHPALDDRGFLRDGWLVHHINGDKLDNQPTNLAPMKKGSHARVHANFAAWHSKVRRMEKALEDAGIEVA